LDVQSTWRAGDEEPQVSEQGEPQADLDFRAAIKEHQDLLDRMHSGDAHAFASLHEAVTGVRVSESKVTDAEPSR
jgi:hypothetical protein